MEEQEFSPLVRAVGVIDENRNFIPYGSTMVAKGIPVFVFDTKEEYDQHAPTLPEPCAVITLDDIDTGGFEFDAAIDPESENAVQNKVIAAALEALRNKANFDRPGMVQFTDSATVTDRNSGFGLSAIEKNSTIEGSLANGINKISKNLGIIKNLGVTGGASVTNAMSAISSYLTLEAGTYICIGKIQKECDMGLMYENGSLAYLMTGSRFFTTCVSFSSQTKIAFSAQSSSGFTLRDDMNLNLLQLIKMK